MTDLLSRDDYKKIAGEPAASVPLLHRRREGGGPLGPDLRDRQPGRRRGARAPAGLRGRGRRRRGRQRPRRLRGRPLVEAAPGRPQGRAAAARRPDRGEPGRAVGDGEPRQRQDHLRLPDRRPARDGEVPALARRGDRQDLRPGVAGLRRPYRARRPRAGRRRRAGAAVELPAADARLEDRPGARRRLHAGA